MRCIRKVNQRKFEVLKTCKADKLFDLIWLVIRWTTEAHLGGCLTWGDSKAEPLTQTDQWSQIGTIRINNNNGELRHSLPALKSLG